MSSHTKAPRAAAEGWQTIVHVDPCITRWSSARRGLQTSRRINPSAGGLLMRTAL